jgi:hypothetical protein
MKFANLLVRMFNIQGYLFLKDLQAEEGVGTMLGYLNDVGEVHGLHTEEMSIALTDDTRGDNSMVDAIVTQLSHVHIGGHCSCMHDCVAVDMLLHLQG